MTTATSDRLDTAPAPSEAPTNSDLASLFYGSPKAPAADLPKSEHAPTPPSEPGPSVSAGEQPTDSSEKANAPPTGKAEEQVAEKEAGKDEGGHQAAARKLGRQVKDLETQLTERDERLAALSEEVRILKAKADGTYQEPKAPTAEEIRQKAIFDERERHSRTVAQELYGRDVVKKAIYDDGSAYEALVKRKPWLQLEVMRHESPTVRGMQLLALEDFTAHYGDDPGKWIEKIVAEVKPKLFEEFKSHTTATPVGREAPSVSDGRGSGESQPRQRSMADLFYGPSSTK